LVIFCVFLIESMRLTMSLNAGNFYFAALGFRAGLGFGSLAGGSAFGASSAGGSANTARIWLSWDGLSSVSSFAGALAFGSTLAAGAPCAFGSTLAAGASVLGSS
jgi:hypothetical protein